MMVDEKTIDVAKAMYDVYCSSVGGKAFNGDPLPKSAEFFSDPKKVTQSNAWINAAIEAKNRFQK